MNDNDNRLSSASQNARIIAYLETGGSLTTLDALKLFGCMRLASRIHDLRERGYEIEVSKVTTNTGKIVASYRLPNK